jgi:hypothetical protein
MIDSEHDIPDDAVSFFPTLSLLFTFNFISNWLFIWQVDSANDEQKRAAVQSSTSVPDLSDRP